MIQDGNYLNWRGNVRGIFIEYLPHSDHWIMCCTLIRYYWLLIESDIECHRVEGEGKGKKRKSCPWIQCERHLIL
jgi:hypothetical protein